MAGNKIIKVSAESFRNFTKSYAKKGADFDKLMEKRVTQATDIVWRVARAKRPMITKAMMKAQGRSKRVSDPNAVSGVPVQTGLLQASIQKLVKRSGYGVFVGQILTRSPYTAFVEFGTSKMRARPFLRPAIALTQASLKKLFGMSASLK